MISVITPCLNILKDGRKDYFKRMMESVHTQSYEDIEHIILDGGSSDGTKDLIEEYVKMGWVTHFNSEEGLGIYSALNKGIRISKGEYINVMNTDDYITDPDFFEISVSTLKEKQVDFTHADRIIESRHSGAKYIKRGNERTAFFRMPFRHQTMIVRKSVFDELGLFGERYKIVGDYEYILRMLLANKKGHYIPKIFIYSLDGGVSSNKELCVSEVSQVLYNSYGKRYGLSLEDCKDIYLGTHLLPLLQKIVLNVKNNKIRNSLLYGYYPGSRNRTRVL